MEEGNLVTARGNEIMMWVGGGGGDKASGGIKWEDDEQGRDFMMRKMK